jgi:hypothetical protein
VARNRYDALTIAHNDMLSLTHDSETGFLQCADSVEMINAWNACQD